jgi:hypothetical protein
MFRAATVLLCMLMATPALAQTATPPVEARGFRASIGAVKFDTSSAAKPDAAVARRQRSGKRGLGERIGWTALAGLGGFFAGGYIGAAIEGDRCNCDDPGLQGALIGIPIGTAAAAITTWVVTGR